LAEAARLAAHLKPKTGYCRVQNLEQQINRMRNRSCTLHYTELELH